MMWPSRRAVERPRDEGTALLFALVFIIIGSFLILPMLSYASTVFRSGGVTERKANRAEALRGSLRLALADPSHLYAACSDAGLHLEVVLASPPESTFGVPMRTACTAIGTASEANDADLRVALATVAAGSAVPAGTVGTPYANSGAADVALWLNDTTTTSTGGKIFLPFLPTHGLNHPTSAGYMMPAWAGSCRVYFPGTYLDPITINDGIPTFFASGVYYFENTVTFGANANVVVGEGAIEGCTTNAEAAFYALNAPATISISGIGATFVFGGAGRMVVSDEGTTTGPTVRFNARLVDPTDVGNSVSHGVSIISVNGVQLGSTSSADLLQAGYLQVPKSLTESNPTDAVAPVDAASTSYHPSTLYAVPAPLPQVTPIISVEFGGTGAGTLYVPGYVAVPQGRISVSGGAGSAGGKSVQLLGGILAATIDLTGEPPTDLQLGMVNRIVQRTFKLIAETTSGSPYMQSIAIVQINDYGEYAINSWVTAG